MSRDLVPFALRNGSSGLGGGWMGSEEPMSSMGNLMDVMLVFACGLMLALVAYWNVDLSSVVSESTDNADEQYERIDGELEEASESLEGQGEDFEELGVVYRDPSTGTLYVIPNDES